MTLFRFRQGRVVPDFDVLEFDAIENAIAHAEALMRRNGYTQIEIVDGDAVVMVNRPA